MKLIASDYDGTLNHGGFDEKKLSAIEQWRNRGNIFSLISGRSPGDLLRICREKGFGCDFLIADNGAVIMTADGKVVSRAKCDGRLALPLIKLIFDSGCDWVYVQSDYDYNIYKNAESCKNSNDYILSDMPSISCFNQINTRLIDFESAEKLASEISSAFKNQLNPLQNGNCIDIVRHDINKANGIYSLMELTGVKYYDVIAVGDNVNDRDMIKEFRSYAMENGVELIKQLADNVTPSVTDLIVTELKYV